MQTLDQIKAILVFVLELVRLELFPLSPLPRDRAGLRVMLARPFRGSSRGLLRVLSLEFRRRVRQRFVVVRRPLPAALRALSCLRPWPFPEPLHAPRSV